MKKLILLMLLIIFSSCTTKTHDTTVIVYFTDNTNDTLLISNRHTIRHNYLISYDDFGNAYVVATEVKYIKKINAI